MERNPEELIRAARAAADNLLQFRMAEIRRQFLERAVAEYVIRLGLAKTVEEAENVPLEEILKAETARALS